MRITKKFYIAAASIAVTIGALVALNVTGTTGQAISSFRNCNDDSIIRCGAITEAELLQKYDQNVGDVQHVYSHYGISRSDIAGTTSTIRHGTVYRDGRVVVDGKTVATGAYSVSRIKYTSAGQPHAVSINGRTYYEGPSMQIFTGSVDAYVMFRNGRFYKAVLSSCGNPLLATPTAPEPVYTCDSLKNTKIDRTRFRFDATATAKNGAKVTNYTYDFGDGTKVTDGASVEHTYAKAGTYTISVTVNFSVDGESVKKSGANCKTTITVEEKPVTPIYTCESLKNTKIDRTRFRFDTVAIAKDGAVVVDYTYDFGDNTKVTSGASVEHTYANAGTYTMTVTVNFKVNGKAVSQSGPNCKATVSVAESPLYTCDSLKATKIDRTTYQFNAKATALNGASVENFAYDFGDGQSLNSKSDQVSHVYAKAGTYTAVLTVNFRVNDEAKPVTGPNCKTTITVEEKVTPVYTCDSLEANKITRTNYRFDATATAKDGAKVVDYSFDFGDGGKSKTTSASVTHEYAKAGTYTITVNVNFEVNGQAVTQSGPNCKTTITVEEKPATPIYKCDNLTAKLIKDRTYAYTLSYTADGGADLTKAVYDFGDNTSETFTKDKATNVQHTFAEAGTYTTTATLYFTVKEGENVSERTDTCEYTITIKEQEFCPLPGKEHLPKDSPECKEKEMCTLPGKEDFPKDSPECQPCELPGKEHLPKDSTECVPPELPKTGFDMFIGGGLGLGSLSAAGYYWITSRRNLLDTLNSK